MTKVLVVDDDADYRLVVRLALEDEPSLVVVAEASDPAEAVAAAERTQPDLVLLDCVMPGSDPLGAVPKLRSVAPGAAVVMLSPYPTEETTALSETGEVVAVMARSTPATLMASELVVLAGLVGTLQEVVHEAKRTLAADVRSAGDARRFAAEHLAEGVEADPFDTLNLLTSELVTNAVVHAHSEVEVTLRLTGLRARVEVSDTSDIGPEVRDANDDATSGRGLQLVNMLARRWGIRHLPGGGKTVWFEVDRAAPEASTNPPNRDERSNHVSQHRDPAG